MQSMTGWALSLNRTDLPKQSGAAVPRPSAAMEELSPEPGSGNVGLA